MGFGCTARLLHWILIKGRLNMLFARSEAKLYRTRATGTLSAELQHDSRRQWATNGYKGLLKTTRRGSLLAASRGRLESDDEAVLTNEEREGKPAEAPVRQTTRPLTKMSCIPACTSESLKREPKQGADGRAVGGGG
ncbi:hypothetical protein NQZ68_033326 [Dissostichus eleginoides]|nr:hypothetical protein NQZ68_033326 [Dissostichus eleginoides]